MIPRYGFVQVVLADELYLVGRTVIFYVFENLSLGAGAVLTQESPEKTLPPAFECRAECGGRLGTGTDPQRPLYDHVCPPAFRG